MKKKIKYSLLFFLCGFLVLQSCSKTTYTGLNSTDFNHLSTTRKVFSLTIDTRSDEDFAINHMQNAINIPFSENFIKEVENYLTTKTNNKKAVLFIYGADAYITQNQVNEIKQILLNKKHKNIIAVNYLTDDYTY